MKWKKKKLYQTINSLEKQISNTLEERLNYCFSILSKESDSKKLSHEEKITVHGE